MRRVVSSRDVRSVVRSMEAERGVRVDRVLAEAVVPSVGRSAPQIGDSTHTKGSLSLSVGRSFVRLVAHLACHTGEDDRPTDRMATERGG